MQELVTSETSHDYYPVFCFYFYSVARMRSQSVSVVVLVTYRSARLRVRFLYLRNLAIRQNSLTARRRKRKSVVVTRIRWICPVSLARACWSVMTVRRCLGVRNFCFPVFCMFVWYAHAHPPFLLRPLFTTRYPCSPPFLSHLPPPPFFSFTKHASINNLLLLIN